MKYMLLLTLLTRKGKCFFRMLKVMEKDNDSLKGLSKHVTIKARYIRKVCEWVYV